MKKKEAVQVDIIRDDEEPKRLLFEKGSLTIGKKKKNDIVLQCPLKKFPLLRKKSNGYELFIPPGMGGIISPPDGEAISVGSLRELDLLTKKKYGHIFFLSSGTKAELHYEDIRLKLEHLFIEVPCPPLPEKAPSKKVKEFQSYLDRDRKDFMYTIVLSGLLHGILFLYFQFIPYSPKKQVPLSHVPDRFVKLIIKPKSSNPFEKQEVKKIQDKIKKAIELKKPKIVKTAKTEKTAKIAEKTTKENKSPTKTKEAPKKVSENKKKSSGKSKPKVQKPSLVAQVKKNPSKQKKDGQTERGRRKQGNFPGSKIGFPEAREGCPIKTTPKKEI